MSAEPFGDADGLTPKQLHSITRKFDPISHDRVEAAMHLVSVSGAIKMVKEWRTEDRMSTQPGGRKAMVSDAAALTLLMLLATSGRPLQVTWMEALIRDGLTRESRETLGLIAPSYSDEDWYHRLARALQRFLDVIDPMPGNRRGRKTNEQVIAIRNSRSVSVSAIKQARLDRVCNALIEASIKSIQREDRNKWEGNTSVDATVVAAYGKRGSNRDLGFIGHEYDAKWYVRTGDHRDTGDGKKGKDRFYFGWEAHLSIMATNTGIRSADFPLLAVGIAFDTPGTKVAENTVALYTSMRDRHHKPGYVAADRIYFSGQTVEKFHLPMRAMGHKTVTDYEIGQLGTAVTHEGAIQVEGSWYCPDMPASLISATIDLRASRIDEATYDKRIESRRRYQAKPKGHPDKDGFVRYMHPTINGRHTCNQSRAHAPKFCQQRSVSFSPDAGAKHFQHLPYATPEWRAAYNRPRNTIEGFNGLVKDESYTALHLSGLRRLRGYAAQYLLSTLIVVAANLRKIDSFYRRKAKDASKALRAAKRRTVSLLSFAPPPVAEPDDGLPKTEPPDLPE